MKMLILALFASSTAFADLRLEEVPTNNHVQSVAVQQEVNFSYTSSHSAYACSYFKKQAKTFLGALGATDVKVSCSGGLPYDNFLTGTITFKSAVPMEKYNGPVTPDMVFDAHWSHVKIEGRESCDFNERLMDDILKGFEVDGLESSNTCWHSQGRFEYHLNVLK